MKKLLLIAALLVSSWAFSQESATIKGTIIDEGVNGQPMHMAKIALKGTDYSVQSNFFGDFEIEDIQPGHYELQISFAGYETVSLPLLLKANETIELQQGLFTETISMGELMQLTSTSDNTTNFNTASPKE